MPYVTLAKKRLIIQKIKELEDKGCDCDLMAGWSCDIHQRSRELQELLK